MIKKKHTLMWYSIFRDIPSNVYAFNPQKQKQQQQQNLTPFFQHTFGYYHTTIKRCLDIKIRFWIFIWYTSHMMRFYSQLPKVTLCPVVQLETSSCCCCLLFSSSSSWHCCCLPSSISFPSTTIFFSFLAGRQASREAGRQAGRQNKQVDKQVDRQGDKQED